MSSKPKFLGKTATDKYEMAPGFFRVFTVSSDGQNVSIDFPEWIIPALNEEILERSKACIEDAFYRVRPDLRKQ